MPTPLDLVAGQVRLRQVLRAHGLRAEVVERRRVMTGLLAWLVVAVGSLLVIAVGASLAMQPRGEPFGEPYDVFEEE
jgi:hypothetical protein